MTPFPMCRDPQSAAMVRMAGWLALLALVAGPLVVTAQSPPKAAAKKAASSPQPAEKPADQLSEKIAEPATPDQAARVLDLRTFPLMEGAKLRTHRTLGMLMYEANGAPKAAFEFQRQELVQRGFKELPGGYSDATNNYSHFVKEGFHVAVSASQASGDPQKAGSSSVALVNDGNVDVNKLPVPPGVKPFHPRPNQASYTTDAKVVDTAAECRKLLLAAGWEPYGEAGTNDADSSMLYFKRNAIKLLSWVMTTPAEGGKTLIRYQTELLSVDLPAPPDAADPRYTDFQKRLWFESPAEKTDAIIAFYQERLPKQGWKATTGRPIVNEKNKSQFVVYRNSQKDLLSLDLLQYAGKVSVTLKQQTEAEVAEEERLAEEQAEKERLAEAKRNMKIKVAVPLPAKAENIEHERENLIEFTLATGCGPAALELFREHFRKEGWTEQEGAKFEKNTGSLHFKKDRWLLSFSYFDIGFSDAEIRVSAYKGVILEPTSSKGEPLADKPSTDKPQAEKPQADKPESDKPQTVKKPAKKPTTPAIPGLPELPPGVELPDDVKALLEKALKEVEIETPTPAKKPAKKKP